MLSLSEAKVGEKCMLKWMMVGQDLLKWMGRYDVTEGSEVDVICNQTGNVIIGFNGSRLLLGREVAERIKI